MEIERYYVISKRDQQELKECIKNAEVFILTSIKNRKECKDDKERSRRIVYPDCNEWRR